MDELSMLAFHLGMRLLTVFSLGCLLMPGAVVAVSGPTPGDQDLIRDRQERLLEEQQRRLEELKELPGKQVTSKAPPLLLPPMSSMTTPRAKTVRHCLLNVLKIITELRLMRSGEL